MRVVGAIKDFNSIIGLIIERAINWIFIWIHARARVRYSSEIEFTDPYHISSLSH
jgi:hypothetical protein